jgi:DNA-binding XRE family transcriptional regulator
MALHSGIQEDGNKDGSESAGYAGSRGLVRMNEGNWFRFDLWLYNEMQKRGWDIFDMSVYADISPQTISAYLKGKFEPTLKSFGKILNAFGKHVEIVDN